jgi:hypothetical protein
MKKITALLILAAMVVAVFAIPSAALAVKPATAAQFIPWRLSAAVMPVPPYGSVDIPGSDTASKLIVTQPSGTTQVAITGVMGGLAPLATYTVYLSNGYTPYVVTGWSLNGITGLDFNSTKWPGGNPYHHAVAISGGTATGSSTGNTYTATVSVVGDAVTIVAVYNPGSGAYPYTYTAIGTISAAGVVSGTWSATDGDSGTWNSATGTAAKVGTGSTGWPGLFSSTIPPFTFTTDEFGRGSWHVNVKDADVPTTGLDKLSVWINSGGTMLVSDTFGVLK